MAFLNRGYTSLQAPDKRWVDNAGPRLGPWHDYTLNSALHLLAREHPSEACVCPPSQESREVLARLKRSQGFESQNFDPLVSSDFCVSLALPSLASLPCHIIFV